ncbi:MAG: hypothetical protein KME38_15565 [Spirirestis rafaelensis WJT71-NPBG6]|nr:hypothetical protein [Spirirestis rafaelensis WJT71-NPBG6]
MCITSVSIVVSRRDTARDSKARGRYYALSLSLSFAAVLDKAIAPL